MNNDQFNGNGNTENREVSNTQEYGKMSAPGGEPMKDPGQTPVTGAEPQTRADRTDAQDKTEYSGEYHYSGNGMGGYGKDIVHPSENDGYRYGYDRVFARDQSDSASANSGDQSNPSVRQYGEGADYGRDQQQYNAGQGIYGRGFSGPIGPMYGPSQMYTAPENDAPRKKSKDKKRAGRGVSTAALAVTVAASILLSAAAGFGGAYIYSEYSENSGGHSGFVSKDFNSTAVIQRTVQTDGISSTGDGGGYIDVAAAVKDSVVEITTEFTVTGFFQYVTSGAGSGVIISEDGYIITNNHVISDDNTGAAVNSITVHLTNGSDYEARLVGRDSDSDIAVIKIDVEEDDKITAAVFGNSDLLAVGEEVIAVGNPLGELGGTVTNGIISALDREISVDGTSMNLLQTNAAINPGNSGGGLFNMKGELVGIVNAKSSGSGIEGLGFAIPSNDAEDVAVELLEHGYVTGKVAIGVTFAEISDAMTAYRYFGSSATGIFVNALEEGMNDDVLKRGDRVVAVEGKEITEISQIKDIVTSHDVGDKIKFTLYRGGRLTEIEVTCYEYVPDDAGTGEGPNVNFDDED